MNRSLVVDMFVEDHAQEEFLKPLIGRIGMEEGVEVSVNVRSARGGPSRATGELELYQKLVEKGIPGKEPVDLLVVAMDGNCTTFAKKRNEIEQAVKSMLVDRLVVACPDPHVERWYLADGESFQATVGCLPSIGRKKCEHHYYKNALAAAVRQAGHPSALGGIEFARELAMAMDLYRAGKNDHSLRAFVEELRQKLKRLRNE